ncbi:glyoxalase/bleomycin resistance protein/dioxygenase [Novosphingobium sp. Rr 2-17]|uniref:VOC family protein n=1 Tax=Novosphingobium sp. Rr 2-17 TaxID=555793 RepID=UPI0002699BAE|nr:VOC family protein [Novosphingobium sp. Rr 2-17]EIZ79080.1 glyoxalase/bleomycin resistance protein/dioxygenase [Novosphingobium sp. Rr 2-17]
MFIHVMVGTDDIDAARAFYDPVLGALGIAPGVAGGPTRIGYAHEGNLFVVTVPIDGGAASASNGATIAFRAPSREAVDAWHQAGLAHGGTTCEDPPGLRNTPLGRAYLAYLRDPAGNKLCAAYKEPV